MKELIGQEEVMNEMSKIISIFKTSEAKIRHHFILTGPSGTGKSLSILQLAERNKLFFLDINAAQLTKEGTSGNSVSKVLSPLRNCEGMKGIVSLMSLTSCSYQEIIMN